MFKVLFIKKKQKINLHKRRTYQPVRMLFLVGDRSDRPCGLDRHSKTLQRVIGPIPEEIHTNCCSNGLLNRN